MNLDTAPPKHNPGVCRCCLSEGCYKDLSTEYTWVNETEIYADMLLECFDVSISQHAEGPNGLNRYICEVCITRLRDAFHFKQQVICSEKKFIDMVSRGEFSSEKTAYSEFSLKQEDQTDGERSPAVEYLDEGADFSEEDDKPLKDMSSVKEAVTALVSAGNESCRRPKRKQKSETKDKTLSKRNKLIKEEVAETSTTLHKEMKSEDQISARMRKYQLMRFITAVIEHSTALPFRWCGNKYMCFYCCYTFSDCVQLKEHTSEHRHVTLKYVLMKAIGNYQVKLDISSISCTSCDLPLQDFEDLFDHLCKRHGVRVNRSVCDSILTFKLSEDGMICLQCGQNFAHFGPLLLHSHKLHSGASKFLCEVCGQSFRSKSSVLNHSRRVHSDLPSSCEVCNKTYTSLFALNKHNERMHKNARLTCPKCPEVLSSNYLKKRHLALVHDKSQFRCERCPKAFMVKNALIQHIKRVHLKEKTVECEICGFRVFNKTLLRCHLVKHDDSRPFECALCKKTFQRKKTLDLHTRTHTNDRRYACKLCDKAFVQVTSLKLHVRVHHSNENAY